MEDEKKGFGVWLKKNTVLALVCAMLLGVLVGSFTMNFIVNGKAAYVNSKAITTKQLYNKMKKYYPIDLVLEEVDSAILKNKYKLDENDYKEIEETAEYYLNMYKNYYGYDEEEFLSENGFESKEAFIDYLSIDYKKNIYFYEYLESLLEKNAVEDYYEANSFGTVNTKHILVETDSEDVTDEQALALAKEIIARLDAGENFDDLADEYTEKYPDYVITEDLGEQSSFSHLEEAYLDEMKELNKGEYSKEPVKTSYGYHVVYCVDKTEKSDQISRADRMEIIEILSEDIVSEDSNLYYKAIIELRKKAGLVFYDEFLNDEYEEYCAKYLDTAETETEVEE